MEKEKASQGNKDKKEINYMTQKKKKRKATETKVKDPKFIRFSKVQVRYLNEVRTRTVNEFNAAVDAVCEELGIVEKIKQAPPGMYNLRMSDLSGLDISSVPPKDPPSDPPKKPPTKPPEKKSERQVISKEKGRKDN